MASPDREPTTGELYIMLENVMMTLREMRTEMATKEFVNAKFEAYGERVVRLEDDLKKWITTSTEAHITLDRDSKARHKETEALVDALALKTDNRFAKIEEDQKADQRELKGVKNNRVTAWIGIGLALVSNLIFWFVTSGGR